VRFRVAKQLTITMAYLANCLFTQELALNPWNSKGLLTMEGSL